MTAPSNLREALEQIRGWIEFSETETAQKMTVAEVELINGESLGDTLRKVEAALATLSRLDGDKREAHPIGQGLLRTQEIMQAETMKAKIAALAHRFWSIHPSEIAAKNLTREEFYIREMTALLSSGLVQYEAAIRAEASRQYKDAVDSVNRSTDREIETVIRADEREKCAKVAEKFGEPYALNTNTGAMMFRSNVAKIVSAIRDGASDEGEK